ncbi:MAG: hypothetical protein J6T70_04590 [Bacteroidales bacterium]|nr:hypothetical protein [Bacteroidales bacterium]
MEKINAFWNAFKNIIFSNDYEEKEILLETLKAFLKQKGLEDEFAAFYTKRKNTKDSQNTTKYQNYNNSNGKTFVSQQPKGIVLFVKADRGKSVIDHIRSTNSLDESIQDQLSEFTSYLWLGNGFDDSIFEKPENVSEIVPEYDVVAIKTTYPQGYPLKDKSDGYELRQLIKTLCKKNARCEKISNRLSFDDINGLEKYQVN